MKLTRQGFEKARVFMKETSRDLDRRIFEYRFEGAPRDRALEALATYANPDGGFGHGLEADVRAEASSPAVTAWAFQTLREVDAPSKHALVRRGIRFFLRTYIDRLEGWPRVVPGFNDAPRNRIGDTIPLRSPKKREPSGPGRARRSWATSTTTPTLSPPRSWLA